MQTFAFENNKVVAVQTWNGLFLIIACFFFFNLVFIHNIYKYRTQSNSLPQRD